MFYHLALVIILWSGTVIISTFEHRIGIREVTCQETDQQEMEPGLWMLDSKPKQPAKVIASFN